MGRTQVNGERIKSVELDNSDDITGVLPIVNGGLGANTANAGFNNIAPTSQKGDLIVRNASNDNVRLPVGNNNEVLSSDSSTSTGLKWIDMGNVGLNALGDMLSDPTGFVDNTKVSYSFNDSTRTFSIKPKTPTHTSYDFTWRARAFNKTAEETIVIPNVSGTYHFYFDQNGVLQYREGFDVVLIRDEVYVANVKWDAVKGRRLYLGKELHTNKWPWAVHYYAHTHFGSRYGAGLALSGFSATEGDGSQNSHAQFIAEAGYFDDEDLRVDNPEQPNINIWFYLADWDFKVGNSYPVVESGSVPEYTGANGRVAYNSISGGVGTLVEVPEGKYVIYSYFGSNDETLGVVGVVGRNVYDTAQEAKAAALTEIATITGLPLQEYVPVGSVIWKTSSGYTNAPKAKIVWDSGSPWVDFRTSSAYKPIQPTGIHGLLSGLADDDHTQYYNQTRGDARYTQLSTLTTKGDLYARTSTGVDRLGVGADNQVLVADSATASGVKWFVPLPEVQVIKSTTTTTVATATDTLLSGMTTTPVAGTYDVEFEASGISNSNNGRITSFSLYVGGVIVTNSTRTVGNSAGTTDKNSVTLTDKVTVNGSQAIEIRWNASVNTSTCIGRSLKVTKVQ